MARRPRRHPFEPWIDSVSRDLLLVIAGNLARYALGFGASILIARALGPANLGTFAILAAVSTVVGAIAEGGLTDIAVNRIAVTLEAQSNTVNERVQAFVWLRLAVTVLVVGVGVVISLLLPADLLPWPNARLLLVLTMLGVLATAMSGTVTAVLQAMKRFRRLAIVGLTNAVLTTLLAAILYVFGRLDLITAVVVLGIGTSLISFLVGVRLVPLPGRFTVPERRSLRVEGRELIGFGRWLWLSNVWAILSVQLDVLLVGHWSDPATLGAYGLALNLVMKVDVVNSSLYTVLLPTVSSLSGAGAIRRYLRRAFLRSFLISVALLPLLPFIGVFIPFFYGTAYATAVPFFQRLLGVVVLDLFATPIVLLAYHYHQPRLLAGADALRLVTLFVVGFALIPEIGPSGAIAAKLLARVTSVGVMLVFLGRVREGRSSSPAAAQNVAE